MIDINLHCFSYDEKQWKFTPKLQQQWHNNDKNLPEKHFQNLFVGVSEHTKITSKWNKQQQFGILSEDDEENNAGKNGFTTLNVNKTTQKNLILVFVFSLSLSLSLSLSHFCYFLFHSNSSFFKSPV